MYRKQTRNVVGGTHVRAT